MKLEGKKILLVEDDKFLGEMLAKKFLSEKAVFEYAPDGEVAISKLKEKKYDLVLLDLLMPKIGGFEVLETMSGNSTFRDTPVIILSNLGQKSDVDRGMKLGAKKFLVKAILSLDEIVQAVSEVF